MEVLHREEEGGEEPAVRGGIYRLTMEVLREAGVRPSRRRGQHFLVDESAVGVFLAEVGGWGEALEVGPGTGAITIPASRVVGRIVAVEADGRLAAALAPRLPPNVELVVGDGVSMASSWRGDLFSNAPYNIASRLIASIARNNWVSRAVLGVQWELARRVAARPGTRDYGRLTLLARRYFRVRIAGFIPPSAYYPEPQVAGGVLVLERVRRWAPGDEAFERLTACLFSMRNKLASKAARICLSRMGAPDPGVDYGGRRVRDLEPWEVEELAGLLS